MIRSRSRAPGNPESISAVCPDGDTYSAAFPPSTSTTQISSGFGFCRAPRNPAANRAIDNIDAIRFMRISSSTEVTEDAGQDQHGGTETRSLFSVKSRLSVSPCYIFSFALRLLRRSRPLAAAARKSEQFVIRPWARPARGLLADGFHRRCIDGRSRLAPFASDVRQYARDLIVAEH